jgi:hypothetical protein
VCERVPVVAVRDRGVHQRHDHAGQLDPLVAGVLGLTLVRVVVAPHHVETFAERTAVAVLERRPLLGLAVLGEITLHDHGHGIDGGDLGDGCPVHHLRIRRLTGRGPLDGALGVVVDATGLGLAEVHVVDGGHAAQQLPRRGGKGAHLVTDEVVLGVGRQSLEAVGRGALVEDGQVVGDGRDVHGDVHGDVPQVLGVLSARVGRDVPAGARSTSGR